MIDGMILKAQSIFEAEYSVLDLETTGLSASSDRIIEIGIVRIEKNKIKNTFRSFVNPGIPISANITELTGISNDDTILAPYFDDLVEELLEFIGDSTIVAHNYSFDLKFLNAELRRAGYAKISNPTVCTLRLTRKLFPDLRSKSLTYVAKHLRIKHKDVHRALGDAMVTAKIFLKQLKILNDDLEIENVKELLAFAALNRNDNFFKVKKKLAEGFEKLSFSPGVYLFKDKQKRVIYVGKAKSLRNRVMNHFSSAAVSKSRKIINKAESIEFKETGSELSALITEAELIKKFAPEFNVQLKKYPRAYFIKVNLISKFGGVSVTSKFDFDGNDYFGPYSNMEIAQKIVGIINANFKLRECSDKEFKNAKPCYLYEINRCLAPCIYSDIGDKYSVELMKAEEFLKGRNEFVIKGLIEKMKKFSDEKKYEKAAEIRDFINLLLNQLSKISVIKTPVNKANILGVVKEGKRKDLFILSGGKIVFKNSNIDSENLFFTILKDYYNGVVTIFRNINKSDIERLRIALSWIARNKPKMQLYNLSEYSSEKELMMKLSGQI